MRHADTACWGEAERALATPAGAPFERGDGSLDFPRQAGAPAGLVARARRTAVEEYRRFYFLAARAGHAVTPSEEVDQVWQNLHLTCTRDYWGSFLPQVLRVALHHAEQRWSRSTRSSVTDRTTPTPWRAISAGLARPRNTVADERAPLRLRRVLALGR